MSWAIEINSRWDSRAEQLEKERLSKFEKGMEGRRYCRVDIASGASVWMWVKEPSKVSQEDFKFNEEYKDYLAILMNPKENDIVEEYFTTMAEELRTGKNAKTGQLLTDLEKAQRWSTVLSAISVVAVGAYYGQKEFTAKSKSSNVNSVKKASGANQKVISELESPVLDGRRIESGAKVDDVKPVWGKDSKGRPVIEKEFPQVAKEHGFPDIIDNYPTSANEYPLVGGDGIDRKFFQLEGSNNDKNGVFEWIVEPNGDVSHRRFIDGGVLTGKPNQIPKK